MPSRHDGPASPLFEPLPVDGNQSLDALEETDASTTMRQCSRFAPTEEGTHWGIPFTIRKAVVAANEPVEIELGPVRASWLVFLHTTDLDPLSFDERGFVSPSRGVGRLGERVSDYVIVYSDGSEARRAIRQRHEIGMVQRPWGENCFEAVPLRKPMPLRAAHEQESRRPFGRTLWNWGLTQTRALNIDMEPWCSWLFAFENPHPRKSIAGLRVEPVRGISVLSAVSAGNPSSNPLRWEPRRKALLKLRKGESFDWNVDELGLLKQVQLDLGQVISAQPRPRHPDERWAKSRERELPEIADDEVLIEYSAHPDARFHLDGGRTLPVSRLDENGNAESGGNEARRREQTRGGIVPVAAATQRVRLRVVEKGSGRPVPVRLHAHGEAGEYLAPVDRHRIPNPGWFEDYSSDHVASDFATGRFLYSTYIPGETTIDLPIGRVYLEVSKGFEVKPIRKVANITGSTKTLKLTVDKVLDWRERGWVTADTHVHFLSPATALLEGSAEGVNVINLLASQWGELMTNVGDFDGQTTFGSQEAGGDGEWLVRVGTENRQHVLGHISLLGYSGDIISPMCSGGADEAAIGDPVDVLLTEWARQCRAQGGLAVFPHFPNPRTENAAALVHGDVDAIEMCSIGNEFTGIDPYSLSDWYRYLNCGYHYPAVGGTDKMAASTAVGTIRTYARIADGERFTYDAWMDAVRSGNTFVTYGPLLELSVEGMPPGSRLALGASGGTVSVEYELASVTMPMTRVELVVNGEIRESRKVAAKRARGTFSLALEKSAWVALLVRATHANGREIVAAHSSAVMAEVKDSPIFAAADAVTILEQIEGAVAYLDTVAMRRDERAYKRMRLVLVAAHRKLHNEMHRKGQGHTHAAPHDHEAHHGSR